MKTINNLWFNDDRIFIETTTGEVRSQPMQFFPRLQQATDLQRKEWTESHFGLHWEKIDEDISFESFTWDDNDPLTLYHQI
ncbi:MAG: DUF2442 domain-containing protein [Chitinophagaceae bacterium]|jgi:hypothetical protein|nr:DUF2442 domain-containing protein [Chitinophagaceae bacterium]